MLVAGHDLRIPGMLVEAADRLVERHLRQRALVRGGDEVGVVPEVTLAVGLPGREALVVIERLVVRLEGRRAGAVGVDDGALLARILAPIARRLAPSAGVPGPGDAFRRERVADVLLAHRRWPVPCRVREGMAPQNRPREGPGVGGGGGGVFGVAR